MWKQPDIHCSHLLQVLLFQVHSTKLALRLYKGDFTYKRITGKHSIKMWLLNDLGNPEERQWMQNKPLLTGEIETLRVRVTQCLLCHHRAILIQKEHPKLISRTLCKDWGSMKPGSWVLSVCGCLCSLQTAWRDKAKLLLTSPELGSAETGGGYPELCAGVENQICLQRRILHD